MENLQRTHFVLNNTYVLPDREPIHVAGAALAIENSDDNDHTLTIADSSDGLTYSNLLLNQPGQLAVLSITIAGHAKLMVSFASAKQYVQLSLETLVPNGLYCDLVQWPPKAQDEVLY